MSDKRIESLVDAARARRRSRLHRQAAREARRRSSATKRRSPRRERRDIDAPVVFLHRDDRFAVVDKPAGITTVPDTRDAHNSLVHRVAREIGIVAGILHVTSRLDRAA